MKEGIEVIQIHRLFLFFGSGYEIDRIVKFD
jgi:hypothetical protein